MQRGEVVDIPSRSQDRHRAQRRGEEYPYFDRWFDRLTTGLSTRLKILSRITEPTSGRVELHGRVSGQLEACLEPLDLARDKLRRKVGAGVHSEWMGRESIYLS